MHLSFCLILYDISSPEFLSLCMYWLCMAEGLAKSRLQIPGEFFFKSVADIFCNYLLFSSFSHNLKHVQVQALAF